MPQGKRRKRRSKAVIPQSQQALRIDEWLRTMHGVTPRPLRHSGALDPIEETFLCVRARVAIPELRATKELREALEEKGEVVGHRTGCIHPWAAACVRHSGVISWILWRNGQPPPVISSPKIIISGAEPLVSNEFHDVYVIDAATHLKCIPIGRSLDGHATDDLSVLNRRFDLEDT
eukprot:TRINITY_DN14373_c0_g1_i1.p2 TRINITY_DN14373_c0_g1~~TRINITY_DN14373_c0_g1_i1.p2  ORF type:complete len:176 (+),score=20.82 TRINITY_DN14373_c0_g1_i1:195-722(+)